MRDRTKLAASLAGVVAALVVPVAAHASTSKTVYMGEPPKYQKTFEQQYSTDAQDYFPHSVTVHVGDSVKFIRSFHTVDFPPRGQKALPFILPNGPQANGVNDAAGSPFWFDGKVTEFGFNPAIAKTPSKGTYNGKTRVESGVPNGPGSPPPFVVKFTKTGSFTYYCNIHPGMKGVVHVVAKTAKAPSAKDDAKAVTKQVNADLASAKQLSKTIAPTGTVQIGAEGPGHVEYYGFFGPTAAISAGTTLRFQMGKGTLETHTATTDKDASSAPPPAPGGETQIPSLYLSGLANTFNGAGPFDPRATFPSDDPGGTPASLSPSLHGNGFWNSGALDNSTASPVPSNASVRFDTPGTYTFYCLIHTFMHFTLKVQ